MNKEAVVQFVGFGSEDGLKPVDGMGELGDADGNEDIDGAVEGVNSLSSRSSFFSPFQGVEVKITNIIVKIITRSERIKPIQ